MFVFSAPLDTSGSGGKFIKGYMKKKDTIGKIASELKEQFTPVAIIDQQRKMQEDYIKELIIAAERGRKKYTGDFFIHVETKKEKLLDNVIRNYFIDRKSCPTPNYDQSVYKYNSDLQEIIHVWTVPDRETCFYFLHNSSYIVQEEKELLDFIGKFARGELFMLCKAYNNEEPDSPILKETNGN